MGALPRTLALESTEVRSSGSHESCALATTGALPQHNQDSQRKSHNRRMSLRVMRILRRLQA